MYAFPEMIDMGLHEGQEFPSDAHRAISEVIGLCNPNVKTRDMLTDIVQAVCKVPENRITTVTYDQLVDEFNLPDVQIFG